MNLYCTRRTNVYNTHGSMYNAYTYVDLYTYMCEYMHICIHRYSSCLCLAPEDLAKGSKSLLQLGLIQDDLLLCFSECAVKGTRWARLP